MLEVLREATSALHIELERITESEKMKEGSYTLEDYQRYLLSSYYFHQAVEQHISLHQEETLPDCLLPYRHKTPYLLQDLQTLQINIPETHFQLTGDSLAHLMGYLYVAEGSMLGAAVIHKLLKGQPQFKEANAFHFLSCYQGQKRTLWNDFKKYVNEAAWSTHQREVMVNAAKEAFLLYKNIYSNEQLAMNN